MKDRFYPAIEKVIEEEPDWWMNAYTYKSGLYRSKLIHSVRPKYKAIYVFDVLKIVKILESWD